MAQIGRKETDCRGSRGEVGGGCPGLQILLLESQSMGNISRWRIHTLFGGFRPPNKGTKRKAVETISLERNNWS